MLQILKYYYARKQLLLSARLSHRSSVCPSVCLSVTRVDQSKTVQATINKSSPSATWKILVADGEIERSQLLSQVLDDL